MPEEEEITEVDEVTDPTGDDAGEDDEVEEPVEEPVEEEPVEDVVEEEDPIPPGHLKAGAVAQSDRFRRPNE